MMAWRLSGRTEVGWMPREVSHLKESQGTSAWAGQVHGTPPMTGAQEVFVLFEIVHADRHLRILSAPLQRVPHPRN